MVNSIYSLDGLGWETLVCHKITVRLKYINFRCGMWSKKKHTHWLRGENKNKI